MTTSAAMPFSGEDLPSANGGKDFGVFLPMANGGWIMSRNAPPLDGGYEYNRKVAVLAERWNLDFILSQAKWRGYGGEIEHWDHTLDAQMLIAALAEVTERIKVFTTVHTLLQNPAVTAKMIATLDRISGGRAGLNVVTGAFSEEFSQMGAWRDDLDHDGRYALAHEWVTAIKRLWSEKSVTMHGQFVTLDDCRSDPKPQARPFLICAGTSPKGVDFTMEHMDAIFLTGKDNKHLGEVSRSAHDQAAARGKTIRTYTMMTLVMAETDAKAEAMAQSYREGLDMGALEGMLRAYGVTDARDGKVNAFVESARSSFMTPRLIGSPETMKEKVVQLLEEAELDGLALVFPDYLTGIEMFGAEVLPALRAQFAGKKDLVSAA